MQATAARTTGRVAKGFGELPCPKCAAEAVIRLDLDDLDTLSCGECDESFTTAEVTAWIDRWTRVLAKVEALRDSL